VLAVPERMSSKSTSICTACWPVRRCTLCTPRYTRSLAQWILPCQIDRTGPRSITVISMGSVLLPDRSSSRQVAGHSSAPWPLDHARARTIRWVKKSIRALWWVKFSLRALWWIMPPGMFQGHALPRI
jgi:hypothetical protein